MYYTLCNNGKNLTHPKVGLWFTDDIEEAKDMLETCCEYLRECGLEFVIENIKIKELESSDDIFA